MSASKWKTVKAKWLFSNKSVKNYPSEPQLSASQKYGVIPQAMLEENLNSRVMAAMKSLENFKLVEKNDFVISLRSFQGGIEHSNHRGIISPAYTVMTPSELIHPQFFRYVLKEIEFIVRLNSVTIGIRDGKTITYDDFGQLELTVPPIKQQIEISQMLDKKTKQIDKNIRSLNEISLKLEHVRSTLITKAVTKGLNPNVPMKDSRIEWVGNIPNHWQTNQLKRQFTFKKGRFGQILTASFLEDSEDKFPVHSGQTKDGGVLGFWDQYEFEFPDGVIFSTTVGAKCMSTKWISGKFSLSQNCMIMIPKEVVVDSKYGEYYLRYYFAEEKKKLPLIMQPSLRFEDLNQFQILHPPINEQRQISTHLDSVEKSIDGVKNSIDIQIKRLKEYRTALISAAVTGKIDVRGL